MIRKFNFTGRRRIPQSSVQIRLKPDESGIPSFDAQLGLEGLGLPPDATVYMEAYDKASYMRFPFGTVGELRTPESRRLLDLQSRDRIFFRVKVVDGTTWNGRVLAIADRLPPATLEGREIEREGYLGVRPAQLGNEIWRLDFEDDGPILELNEELLPFGISDMARSDGVFIGLVYPAVFRQILQAAIEDLEDLQTDDWRGTWLRYAAQLGANFDPDANKDEKQHWIEAEAIPAFCSRFQIKTRFQDARTKEER